MALKIIDVPSVLHSGYGTSFGKRASYKGIPTGGLYTLVSVVAQAASSGDLIALVWDSPTNRRDFLPEYKSTRNPDPVIRFANKVSYKYFKNITSNCYKFEGYEADDIAYNIVEQYKESQFYIELYTADYDWAHNIFSDRQELYPANSNLCRVTKNNFEGIFSDSNCSMKFNALTVKKILFGDPSDHVPRFNPDPLDSESCFKAFINFCDKNNLDYREKDSFLHFVNTFKNAFKSETVTELLNRAEVMFPRKINTEIILSQSKLNVQAFSKLCSLIGCVKICKRLNIPFYEDMGEEQNNLKFLFEEEKGLAKTRAFTLPPEGEFAKADRRAFI